MPARRRRWRALINDSPVSERSNHQWLFRSTDRTLSPVDVALRVAIVGLALATGYIHSTLGGLLFTLNALGYLVAAVAMVIPLSLAVRYRWVVRLGLMGYAATTIIGWAIQGPYYSTAFIAKGIEVALIVLLAIDFARMDGNPVNGHQGRDRRADRPLRPPLGAEVVERLGRVQSQIRQSSHRPPEIESPPPPAAGILPDGRSGLDRTACRHRTPARLSQVARARPGRRRLE